MTPHEYLLDWLSQPQNYPEQPHDVRRIETHISAVFLTGNFAYKLKKPVDFGFLDFTQLEQRHHFCQMEVDLNRRTAPELYLGVIPIYQSESDPKQIGFEPAPGLVTSDYLVKMRQFDPDCVLSRYVGQNPLNETQQMGLAHAIAQLHLKAEPIESGAFLGSPSCVLQPMTDNFPSLFALLDTPRPQQTDPRLDTTSLKNRLNQLELWTRDQHTLLSPMIEQRQANGHVRACHGDLHLDNITLINGKPVLFDGIEFNDQFRWIDTLSDLAFLLIDLDFRGQENLALNLLNFYLRETGDYAGLVLLRFYQTYRALVRAKITGLRYEQLEPSSEDAQQTLKTMLSYIDLAENYAYLYHRKPTLYIMVGVSGSGKSTIAQQLHQQTGALVISSDIERKRLYGIRPQTRVTEAEKAELYGAKMNELTYNTLYQACLSGLQAGLSVIADATFLQAKHRQRFIDLATQLQTDYLMVVIEPNEQLARQWLAQREALDQDPSDANYGIMQRQLAYYEAPSQEENALILQMGQALPNLKNR
jgi:hypothetical protein